MKKVIVGISTAAMIGGFFYFAWYRHYRDAIR